MTHDEAHAEYADKTAAITERTCDSVLWVLLIRYDTTLQSPTRCSFTCNKTGLHIDEPHAYGAVEWDDLDAMQSADLWEPKQGTAPLNVPLGGDGAEPISASGDITERAT